MADKPFIVFISGPYTMGDMVRNVQNAIRWGDRVRAAGMTPFVPHLTHFWDLISPHPYEFWMGIDLDMVSVASAILRLPGESCGADRECERARELGVPVCYDIYELSEARKKKEKR